MVLEFVYPKLENLNIVTNAKKDFAICRDDYSAMLYKIVPQPKADAPYKVKFEIVKVLNDYPFECQIHYKYRLDMFTSDFSKFIGYDQKNEEFYI